MRKLVTVQHVAALTPIEGADRIEVATIGGWRVVVGKGEFSLAEKVAYFEIDSVLPASDGRFESFQARGQKTVMHEGEEVVGHVLKTIKLRGVVSQGLIMGLPQLGYTQGHIDELSAGDDITDALGVFKYEPPLPTGTNIVGPFDSRFAPKTDAVRLQNLTDEWELIKTVAWVPTLKVDGTSQTLVLDGEQVRIFGRNWELSSDAAGMTVASRVGLVDALVNGMAIQFELVGEGVQNNRLRLTGQHAVVFAVWQDGVKLPRSEWPAPALAVAAPELGDEWLPQGTVEEMIEKVNGLRGNFSKDVLDEGVVWHPVDPSTVPDELVSKLDRNCNWKVVSAKWLLKGGE